MRYLTNIFRGRIEDELMYSLYSLRGAKDSLLVPFVAKLFSNIAGVSLFEPCVVGPLT